MNARLTVQKADYCTRASVGTCLGGFACSWGREGAHLEECLLLPAVCWLEFPNVAFDSSRIGFDDKDSMPAFLPYQHVALRRFRSSTVYFPFIAHSLS